MARIYSVSWKDYSAEIGTTSIYVDPAMDGAAEATLRAAITALSTGALQQTNDTTQTKYSNSPAGSSTAQREEKVLIRYEDDVTKDIGTFTIPCFDKAGSTFITNSDFLELGVGEIATLVTQLEANAVSKAGNSITVLSAQYVGRNT